MRKYSDVKKYNYVFFKNALPIPSTTAAKQIFHYTQRLETQKSTEVERSEPSSMQETMTVEDRRKGLFSNNYIGFGFRNTKIGRGVTDEPMPMQIEIIKYQQNSKLCYAEKRHRIENKFCFNCGKSHCIARNHLRKPYTELGRDRTVSNS